MRKKIISALLMISILAFSGCSKDEISNETAANVQTAESTVEEKCIIEVATESSEDLITQLEVSEYIFKDGNNYTAHILLIQNNSTKTISVTSNSLALNKKGNEIGETNGSVEAIGPGEVSYILEESSELKNVFEFEYDLEVSETNKYESVIEEIGASIELLSGGAEVTFANNGSKVAEYVQALAVFTKKGIVVNVDSQEIAAEDTQLEPGESCLKTFDAGDAEFDDVQLYLRGYCEIKE